MDWLKVPITQITQVTGGSTPSRNKSEFWQDDIAWVTPTDLPMPGQSIVTVFRFIINFFLSPPICLHFPLS